MVTLYDVLNAHRTNKHDKRVFGLVIQGGGMRAVYSCGALTTLLSYGFENTFEHIVGSSAGAVNGAYFLSTDAKGVNIYTDRLTNKNFVNLRRLHRLVDIDYLVDDVLKNQQPLNLENLQKTKSQLHIVVTNAQNGAKTVLSGYKNFNELYEQFRATTALPLFYDKEVILNGRPYIDGGVSDLIPVDVAHMLGCTDIVVIMTKQIAQYRFDQKHSRLVKHLIKHFAKSQSQPVRKLLPTNERTLKANLKSLTSPYKNTRIYVVQPSDEEILVSLATIDKQKISELATLGVTDMDTFLHQPLTII